MKKHLLLILLGALLMAPQPQAAQTGEKEQTMNRDERAQGMRAKWGGNMLGSLAANDPELAAIGGRLLYGEILGAGTLDELQSCIVSLAALTACQSLDALERAAKGGLGAGVEPVAMREAIYQCAPYVGLPRVEAALARLNGVLAQAGIRLPLPDQGTVSEQSRLEQGLKTQREIFGAQNIDRMRESAPRGQEEIIANYLTAWCFGDFYTRGGLDLRQRELVTFSAIVALGGCDPQARAHAAANLAVGNSRQNLVDALALMLPSIGFPRTLNGLAAVNAAPEPAPR